MTESSKEANVARGIIRDLLNGKGPAGDVDKCGIWSEAVQAMFDAHAEGGTDAVKAVFNALAKNDSSLFTLVSAGAQDRKTRWTAAEILSTDFPEPKWIVSGLLPEGLVTLAGRPKVGKSWMALQIAHAVATGGMVLDRDVTQGKVLFLAYEDSERRLKSRMQQQGIPPTKDIIFELDWPLLPVGGLSDLQDEVQRGDYILVVIDTLSRALGNADQADLAEMSVIIGNLQRLAQIEAITILTLDHHRKSSGMMADPIDDIIGSTGKAQAVDAALGLYRGKGQKEFSLGVIGREIERTDLALEFNGMTCAWRVLGNADAVRKETFESDVLQAIPVLIDMGELPTTTKIARHLSRDSGNVSRALGELLAKRQVAKGKKVGRQQPYYIPGIEDGLAL